ncbi:hypothetical protein [Acinetobacter sp. YH16050]|uniref:hypothetical protein n=1 Tax=Acinetobacter sp. YH16050 TaxID=2601189 RepID=UPI0015D158AC|nr:hypothetical protein [Acinetobacter sp. YH16050]
MGFDHITPSNCTISVQFSQNHLRFHMQKKTQPWGKLGRKKQTIMENQIALLDEPSSGFES